MSRGDRIRITAPNPNASTRSQTRTQTHTLSPTLLPPAVTSVLRAGGAPELLGALLEGESLFNDASGIVLFDIFLRKVLQVR